MESVATDNEIIVHVNAGSLTICIKRIVMIRVENSSSADETDDLDLLAVGDLPIGIGLAGYDVHVDLHRYPLRIHAFGFHKRKDCGAFGVFLLDSVDGDIQHDITVWVRSVEDRKSLGYYSIEVSHYQRK